MDDNIVKIRLMCFRLMSNSRGRDSSDRFASIILAHESSQIHMFAHMVHPSVEESSIWKALLTATCSGD